MSFSWTSCPQLLTESRWIMPDLTQETLACVSCGSSHAYIFWLLRGYAGGKSLSPRCDEVWQNFTARTRLDLLPNGTWLAVDEFWESFGNGTNAMQDIDSYLPTSFEAPVIDGQPIKHKYCVPPKPSSCKLLYSPRCVGKDCALRFRTGSEIK